MRFPDHAHVRSSLRNLDSWMKVCLFGQNIFQQINAYHTIYATLKEFIYERRLANVKEAILLLAAIMMLTALLIDLFVFTSTKASVIQSSRWNPGVGFLVTAFIVELISITGLFLESDELLQQCQHDLTSQHGNMPPDNYVRTLCELKRETTHMSGTFSFFLQTLLIIAYAITARLYMTKRAAQFEQDTTTEPAPPPPISLYTVSVPQTSDHRRSCEYPAAPPYRPVDPLHHNA
ncbi:hypothetical protein O0I10_011852 [Lichtheimia ornata]|uniref:Uncharacterized protein n=1 Tax=Lichtheimia ornata TaxID=688661 RepID=A0AAD7USU7_9FUNG|nr:uncharacterized protein O0I10_011852 [Lichtheimia ornata]KAJ8652528.1 hypothetical protein O0I10_011852 [Lichtheimia ornata]